MLLGLLVWALRKRWIDALAWAAWFGMGVALLTLLGIEASQQ